MCPQFNNNIIITTNVIKVNTVPLKQQLGDSVSLLVRFTEMFRFLLLLVLVVIVVIFADEPIPSFPLQFSASLEITAHLIETESEFPPRTRRMTLYYNYIKKLARADIEAGYEAAKVYIRRYDKKKEYMVRLPPIDDCKRSYLGEVMPFPDIPEDTVFVGTESIHGLQCNHFVFEDFETRIHMYMDISNGAPVQLIQEDTADGVSTPLLTYDFSDVSLEPPSDTWFELPDGFEHSTCTRHIGGFPYLHIFHYFVRF